MNRYRELVKSLLIAVCPTNIINRDEWCNDLESQLFNIYSIIDYGVEAKILLKKIKKYNSFLEDINEKTLCRLNVVQLSKLLDI